jgi:IS30 family transposase
VAAALIKHAQQLPTELYQSLTWDRGTEMANHRQFTLATDIAVYFCDPRSPWQRGSNENTNRLLRQYLPKGIDLSRYRQYLPKGIDLSRYTQAQLNKVARQLNERPRKTLEYQTPAETFQACVAATS